MMNTLNLCRLLTSLKFYLIRIPLILLALLTDQQLFSQQSSDTVGKPGKKDFKEELCIRTDRDIYIAGEQVWVKIYEISGLTQSPSNISKVVYLELLDKNNFPLKQLKIKTDNSSGSSVFILPDNLSSGNYLIRAYTSWMQNFSADHFSYSTISVINPFESIDHLKLPSNIIKADSVGSVTASLEQSSSFNGLQSKSNNQINYILTLEKQQFSPRGNVRLRISATDKTGKPVISDI